ncbi:YolD-like family protein [Brevibacillus laterosporus]|uniref:YolD-like family protein n=1 Tax=Brevibacillus laterosporus TaxID=1465 RepID=A0AAP3DIM3_BRELA|nr:YolD-like family protein [Brevibacillus laterosporus]MCR8981668.1 YolD-like family protein [Brevibacillus laterosporus]MCZ0808823.1 YolD-like family protein [Brevibacillus laterosporus]MCZ0827204.1 YolD-like family protein [Brevibacillus laterosporus]MCZ0850960.1 YolD-like family protein [Brevibacillus laterosporus]
MASKILDPLVTKFILPEHAEMIRQHHEDKKLIEKPIIEEDELAEFCYRISDSRQYDYALTISWWKETKEGRGVIESAWGWVDKFDSTFKQIKLKNDEDFWWIPVEDVISVES